MAGERPSTFGMVVTECIVYRRYIGDLDGWLTATRARTGRDRIRGAFEQCCGMLSDDERLDLLLRHGAAERRYDVDATMATLDDDPAYEWHPDRRAAHGHPAVREMYEHFLPRFEALQADGRVTFDFRSEWSGPGGRIREEIAIVADPDGSRTRYDYVVAVLVGERGISGERTYASPELLRIFFGDFYEHLPILP